MMAMRPKFDPLDLEMIERIYEVACAYIEARNIYSDASEIAEEEDALRKMLFSLAGPGTIEFDALCDNVLGAMDAYRLLNRRVRVQDDPVVMVLPAVTAAA